MDELVKEFEKELAEICQENQRCVCTRDAGRECGGRREGRVTRSAEKEQ